MHQIAWAVGIMTILSIVSVAHGSEIQKEIPKDWEGASIEVGFSQDGEPEPHLLMSVKDSKVLVFELAELSQHQDRKIASAPSEPVEKAEGKPMAPEAFLKRMNEAVEDKEFFTAHQPKKKGRCKDQYVIRIHFDGEFKERRGCSNQENDPFAAFAQNTFRDGFWAFRRNK